MTHTVYNTNNFMVCIVLNKEIYISINIFVHDIYTICFCKISLKKQKNKFKMVKMLLYCKSLPHQENSRQILSKFMYNYIIHIKHLKYLQTEIEWIMIIYLYNIAPKSELIFTFGLLYFSWPFSRKLLFNHNCYLCMTASMLL